MIFLGSFKIDPTSDSHDLNRRPREDSFYGFSTSPRFYTAKTHSGPRQLLFSFNVLPNGTIRPGAHVRRNDRAAFRPPLVLLDAMPARQRIPAPLRSSRRQCPTGAPAGTCAPDATHWS